MEDFNDGVDGKLASRMRRVNSEQFHTLVRMHLSFELDLNTEDLERSITKMCAPTCQCVLHALGNVWREAKNLLSSSVPQTRCRQPYCLCNDCITEKAKLKKWGLLGFSKKPKSTISLQKGVMEGAPLSHDGIAQVKQLIDYLSLEQSITQEGIFRRTGKLTRQQDLKSTLYQGLPLNLDNGCYSVHDCASVLKSFLAELPEPLLTELHYPAHCQISELWCGDTKTNESRLLRSLQLLLLLLPSENRILLRHVLKLLNKTASFEHSNKMNCDSLATLFTPHLLCPRKLTPEALHVNSQSLSGLIAFMIAKGIEMFDIPPKLATDIRAYWVEQERKLLSPKNLDLNESTSDTTGTAHTVFSFVDHKLTAKANSTQDTQAALAQLYAHIQAMPESAKKRRLVKQFNKENGQGTPRQVKNLRTKSLGDSIKKHIFQKKLLGHKKLIDINIGCNITRSSSEENILSSSLEKSLLPPKALFSKSDDELSMDDYESPEGENLLQVKHMSSSTGSLDTSALNHYKKKKKVVLLNFVNIREETVFGKDVTKAAPEDAPIDRVDGNSETSDNIENCKIRACSLQDIRTTTKVTFSRQNSEPDDNVHRADMAADISEQLLYRHASEPAVPVTRKSNIEVVFSPRKSLPDLNVSVSPQRLISSIGRTSTYSPPSAVRKFWTAYTAHTSTPAKNLLRKSLAASECVLTPINRNDKSMSPITQSTTKMTKAMQETMMTPRSRKPVMIVSGSNLCNLATLNGGWTPSRSACESYRRNSCASIMEECQKFDSVTGELVAVEGKNCKEKENMEHIERGLCTSSNEVCPRTHRASNASITSTFREYLLSRSVLTASPVDLSFTSRTGDFDQSGSDLNMLNDDGLSDSLLRCLDGNQPSSDTSGIASVSPNSDRNDSSEKSENPSPRKRGTDLQRNDSKRSVLDKTATSKFKLQTLKTKQLSESTLKPVKSKETLQETSF